MSVEADKISSNQLCALNPSLNRPSNAGGKQQSGKMRLKITVLCLVISVFHGAEASDDEGVNPEQIHLSFGDNELELVLTWATFNATRIPTVEYGESGETGGRTLKAFGTSKLFVDGGAEQRRLYIHRVTLEGLEPSTAYSYRCGSTDGWSRDFEFKTPPTGNWSPKLVILGDMGSVNAISLPAIQLKAQTYSFDALIHVGDIAYDMADDNGQVGNNFMNQIQPVAARIPYMVCPGNHEYHYNFSHYRERFSMPGNSENLYYSFNMGPVHFVSVNTEAYWFLQYGMKLLVKQYNWLLNDLKEANENRSNRPWIVLYGHRPMYCSGVSPECYEDVPTRSGINILNERGFGLEKVLNDYGVDVVFWGHQHYYERLFPIYDYKVKNGTTGPYVDPGAPIHIITGAGGSDELIEPFGPAVPFSALRNLNYGYTEVQFLNATHMSLKQIATDANNTVVDDVMIVKHAHGPYS